MNWKKGLSRVATLSFLIASLLAGSGQRADQFLTPIGAGKNGKTAFRTQIELTNEQPESNSGELRLFSQTGIDLAAWMDAPQWVGKEGQLEFLNGRISFSIPSRTALILTIAPDGQGELGWARITSDHRLAVRASLQVATLPPSGQEVEGLGSVGGVQIAPPPPLAESPFR